MWNVLDQEIQPETMGKTVRHRMGKLIIQKVSTDGQVFLTHKGHKMLRPVLLSRGAEF